MDKRACPGGTRGSRAPRPSGDARDPGGDAAAGAGSRRRHPGEGSGGGESSASGRTRGAVRLNGRRRGAAPGRNPGVASPVFAPGAPLSRQDAGAKRSGAAGAPGRPPALADA
ncbi:hypothetical protein GCM10010228_41940 [Streptomyces massasporeus]|nr:hypothetical protein GCM10010228_41940 [Streptomyces massasporeus]